MATTDAHFFVEQLRMNPSSDFDALTAERWPTRLGIRWASAGQATATRTGGRADRDGNAMSLVDAVESIAGRSSVFIEYSSTMRCRLAKGQIGIAHYRPGHMSVLTRCRRMRSR